MTALQGFHHVKIPVRDLTVSRGWYERVLGLSVTTTFEEDGAVMGLAMRDESGSVQLALRQDAERAAGWSGFDPVALAVRSPEAVAAWAARLTATGQEHGGVVRGHDGGAVLVGLRDPDGIEIRLYAN